MVICCGVLTVVFGMLYLVQHLKDPFIITYTGERVWTEDEEEAREIARQKREDTDDDGINDYDELSIYETSPYLNDSDSDGLTDDFEVTNGMDPTCPSGQECRTADGVTIDEENELADELASAEQAAAQAQADYERITAALQNMSADDIRSLLLQSGADRAEVEGMTDEQLQMVYGEVLGALQSNGSLEALVQQAQQNAQ